MIRSSPAPPPPIKLQAPSVCPPPLPSSSFNSQINTSRKGKPVAPCKNAQPAVQCPSSTESKTGNRKSSSQKQRGGADDIVMILIGVQVLCTYSSQNETRESTPFRGVICPDKGNSLRTTKFHVQPMNVRRHFDAFQRHIITPIPHARHQNKEPAFKQADQERHKK